MPTDISSESFSPNKGKRTVNGHSKTPGPNVFHVCV